MFKKLFFSTALGLAMMIFTFSPKVVNAEVFNYESLISDNIDYSALHDEYLSGEVDYDAIAATISECNNDNIDYDALVVALGGEVVDHDPTKPVAVEFATDKEAFLAFLEDEKEWSEFEEEYYFYASDDGHVIESTVPLDEELVQNYFYAEDSGDTLQDKFPFGEGVIEYFDTDTDDSMKTSLDNIDYNALHDEYLSGEVDYNAIATTISECNNDNIDYDALVVALGGEVVDHDPTEPVEFTSDKEAFLSFLEDSKEFDKLVENSECYYIDDDGNMVEYADDTWDSFLK